MRVTDQRRYYPPCGVKRNTADPKKRVSIKRIRKAAGRDDSVGSVFFNAVA